MEKHKENTNLQMNELVKKLESLIQLKQSLNDQAVVAYTPLVDDICSRKASENEVSLMLDYLLMYAEDARILQLYKKVCRAYWRIYPNSIASYILEYRKEYDPDSLVGTEYEYLLNEDDETNDR